MLVNDDHLVTDCISSDTFWNTTAINTIIKKYNGPKKPTYKKYNTKRLNLKYNISLFFTLNEKTKTSKKIVRNNR